MGRPKGPLSYMAGGSDWENRCQMDMLVCRGGLKTLDVSAAEIHAARVSRTGSHCDWPAVAQSGNNPGTRERQL